MPQASVPHPSESVYSGVGRVVAVGDLHGNHEGFSRILAETGLIDRKGRWAARDTHLVLMGDVLGRGGEPGKIFAMARRLEAEAPAMGSRVHLLLGNHEAMSILGVLRYNTLEEFRDLASEDWAMAPAQGRAGGAREGGSGSGPESSAERAAAEGAYAKPLSAVPAAIEGPEDKLRRRLDVLGARDFREALSPRGAVGAWLLSHPSAISIDGTLFVHGGLNRAHGRMPLDELNARVRDGLAAPGDGENGAAMRRDGPQWNRDYTLRPCAARGEELEEVLDYHACARMVVGHTPTSCIAEGRAGRVLPMYGGRLYCVDTGIGRAYGGHLSALSLSGGGPEPIYFG
jgi:hypothetical protein